MLYDQDGMYVIRFIYIILYLYYIKIHLYSYSYCYWCLYHSPSTYWNGQRKIWHN